MAKESKIAASDHAPDTIKSIDQKLSEQRKKLSDARGMPCFPMLLKTTRIGDKLVDDIYDELKTNFSSCKKIDVILDSSGGSADAAFNIALLFRQFATESLSFIIPRWAKSAATLLACSGDEILMTPPAELGPLDPQITEMNPLEKRMEQFSPLHIESTLELIREEFAKGHEKLATGLLNRLQFPLTLGSFRKSLDISKQYMFELLSTRMLKDNKEKAKEIAERFTTGFVDHSYCIKLGEALNIGLKAAAITGEQLDIVWDIHKLYNKKLELELEEKRKRIKDQMKDLPPELIDLLPADFTGKSKEGPNHENSKKISGKYG